VHRDHEASHHPRRPEFCGRAADRGRRWPRFAIFRCSPCKRRKQRRKIRLRSGFSSDRARVVTASGGSARVWDAASGKPLAPPLTHQGRILCAAFSRDGARVVAAYADQTAWVWNLPLASGTLVEWGAIAERTSPYMLVNGALSLRSTLSNGSATSTTALSSTSLP
jgi:WD40 repeat protein